MAEPFVVEQRGVGKPDYSRAVSSSRQRSGLYLKYRQHLVLMVATFTDMVPHPYPVAWIQPPLAAGAQSHLYDLSTGLVTPYAWPAGYTLTMVQKDWAFNQDTEIWFYFDGALLACPGISPGGANIYINPVYAYTSLTLDPASAFPHTVDFVVVNVGGAPLEGGITIAAILEEVGSPALPTTKKCICPSCQHLQEVPVGTTKIVCENCGNPYLVYDFSHIKEL